MNENPCTIEEKDYVWNRLSNFEQIDQQIGSSKVVFRKISAYVNNKNKLFSVHIILVHKKVCDI